MPTPIFSELVQVVEGTAPGTLEVGLRAQDGQIYSFDLRNEIVPALTVALAGRCHKSLKTFIAARETTQQPLGFVAGRGAVESETGRPVLSILTHIGVEIVLDLSDAKNITRLRSQLAALEMVVAEPASSKPN